jgi:branched-chain amino acid transport system permease protein
MAFLGGLGTVAGPVLGALLIEPASSYFQQQVSIGYIFQIAYGALFLVVILALPRGIVPTTAELITRLRARRTQAGAAKPEPVVVSAETVPDSASERA